METRVVDGIAAVLPDFLQFRGKSGVAIDFLFQSRPQFFRGKFPQIRKNGLFKLLDAKAAG